MAKEEINHPEHYGGDTPYEAIKVIEAWNLNFRLGNCVKYINRADSKGTRLKDLKKAAWYLNREIAKEEEKQQRQQESTETIPTAETGESIDVGNTFKE